MMLIRASVLAFALLSSRSAAIDPKEPISLDLKDARLSDVIQTLGALANLPVTIGEGVDGTRPVTVRVQDIRFDKALEVIGGAAGISLYLEGGRLVATLRDKTPGAAPALPGEFRNLPRLSVADYSKSFSEPKGVFVRTRWNKGDGVCHRLEDNGRVNLPVAEGESLPLVLSHLAFEPISRTRFFALDGPVRQVMRLPTGGQSRFDERSPAGLLEVTLSELPNQGCTEAERADRLRSQTMVRFEVSAQGDEGPEVVMAPRITVQPGMVFSVQSGGGIGERPERSFILHGYLSRGGDAVGVVFTVTAQWTDPEDGKQYVLAQTDSSREFHPLTSAGVTVGQLPKGPATERPLVIRVFAQ